MPCLTVPVTSSRRTRSLALVLASGLAFAACGSDPEEAEAETPIEDVITHPDQSNDHVDGSVEYDFAPPVGGDHAQVWLNCGVYPVAVPNENAVHTLEHGVVWFAYRPNLEQSEIDKLVALYETEPNRVIVSPYPDLESPITAVAWERSLAVDSADDPRLAEFLAKYVNGAAAPEPSASCEGGLTLDG